MNGIYSEFGIWLVIEMNIGRPYPAMLLYFLYVRVVDIAIKKRVDQMLQLKGGVDRIESVYKSGFSGFLLFPILESIRHSTRKQDRSRAIEV